MKKVLAAAAAIIGALYLVLCFTVYIPKNGFKEMLSSVVLSSLFILVGVAILLIEFLCDGDRKPSLDVFLGKALLRIRVCPNCFRRMHGIKCSDRRETLRSCPNCGVSLTTIHTLEANWFNDAEGEKQWIEKTAYSLDWTVGDGTEEGYGSRVVKKRGDRSLRGISARLDGKTKSIPFYRDNTHEKKLIADAEKIIRNVCPICDGRLSRYTSAGRLEKALSIEKTAYNRISISSKFAVVDDYTRISCPSIHGVFSIQEKRDGEYYCKSIHVSGDAPQAVFEAAQLCSDVRSKTKYWDAITEVRR